MRNILIIGATSAIAEAVAQSYATAGNKLFLVGRDQQKLQALVSDLQVRGAAFVACYALDLVQTSRHAECLDSAAEQMGGIDIVLIAHGTLSDQQACQASFEETAEEFQINAMSVISLLTLIANRLEEQCSGTIAVISSVAGDRGRQSNYVYGAAKGAVSLFLQGLRNRLCKSNVHVLTIKPGFVDTPMTADIPNKGALWAQPKDIAQGIIKAIEKRRNVVYLPWFWWGIMLIIKHIPEFIFKKLSL